MSSSSQSQLRDLQIKFKSLQEDHRRATFEKLSAEEELEECKVSLCESRQQLYMLKSTCEKVSSRFSKAQREVESAAEEMKRIAKEGVEMAGKLKELAKASTNVVEEFQSKLFFMEPAAEVMKRIISEKETEVAAKIKELSEAHQEEIKNLAMDHTKIVEDLESQVLFWKDEADRVLGLIGTSNGSSNERQPMEHDQPDGTSRQEGMHFPISSPDTTMLGVIRDTDSPLAFIASGYASSLEIIDGEDEENDLVGSEQDEDVGQTTLAVIHEAGTSIISQSVSREIRNGEDDQVGAEMVQIEPQQNLGQNALGIGGHFTMEDMQNTISTAVNEVTAAMKEASAQHVKEAIAAYKEANNQQVKEAIVAYKEAIDQQVKEAITQLIPAAATTLSLFPLDDENEAEQTNLKATNGALSPLIPVHFPDLTLFPLENDNCETRVSDHDLRSAIVPTDDAEVENADPDQDSLSETEDVEEADVPLICVPVSESEDEDDLIYVNQMLKRKRRRLDSDPRDDI